MRQHLQKLLSSFRLQVCKGFPMTFHRCSVLGSPAGGSFLAMLLVLSMMKTWLGL